MPPSSLPSSDYRGGGYSIIRIAERAPWMPPGLVPDRLLSASTCICPRVPDAWAVRWVNATDDERLSRARVFGIAPERLPGVIDRVTSGLEDGTLDWPGVFLSLAPARAFARDCLPSGEGVALLGIGLHPKDVPTFLREGAPGGPAARAWGHTGTSAGSPAAYTAVHAGRRSRRAGRPSASTCWAMTGLVGFHSWLCNGLERLVYSELGIRPNQVGLLSTLEEAQHSLAAVSRDSAGKEPGLWLSWLVMRYALS